MPDTVTLPMQEQKFNELYISHVLLNALRAAYQGLYVYFGARTKLTATETLPELEETCRQLDLIHQWWAELRNKKFLSGVDHLPQLTGDCKIAWEMLQAIFDRYSQLSQTLASKEHLEDLFTNPEALHLRIAVHCENAYARQHYIEGLIDYGKIMDDEESINVYSHHAASCQEEVRRVNHCLNVAMEMGQALDRDTVFEIFDETLTLPAILSQKVADLREIFGLYQGGFDFRHTDIPANQIEAWQYYNFTPTTASQWHAAGFAPDVAYAWMVVGMSNPVEALHYQLRQLDVNAAMQWWSHGINGRTAAAWHRNGYTPDQAAAFRSKGIGHPRLIDPVSN